MVYAPQTQMFLVVERICYRFYCEYTCSYSGIENTYRSALPVSKSRWSVLLPTVTGLKYDESY
jgi:hypothetical protein